MTTLHAQHENHQRGYWKAMNRPRLLDLCCKAGGCAVGYSRAGFEVVGVDHESQKRFPFEFHQADALEFLGAHAHEFDAIHASPPCQRYSRAALRAGTSHRHPDLVGPFREALEATRLPYVMENVPGAPLRTWFKLCGTMFRLKVRRHRWFEVNWDLPVLVPMACDHSYRTYSVFGHGSGNRNGNKRNDAGTVAEWKDAMGIDWMVRDELSQAIPPAYTEYIGRQLLERIGATK